jgi:hypothetical protein
MSLPKKQAVASSPGQDVAQKQGKMSLYAFLPNRKPPSAFRINAWLPPDGL